MRHAKQQTRDVEARTASIYRRVFITLIALPVSILISIFMGHDFAEGIVTLFAFLILGHLGLTLVRSPHDIRRF